MPSYEKWVYVYDGWSQKQVKAKWTGSMLWQTEAGQILPQLAVTKWRELAERRSTRRGPAARAKNTFK